MCPFSLKFAEAASEPGYAARGPGERPVGVEALPGDPTSTDSAESRGRSDAKAGQVPVHPGTDGPPLVDLLRTALSEEAWEAFSRGSAIRRAGRAGFARNVCVAIGNWLAGQDEPPVEAVSMLVEALSASEPLVRGHAAWALGQVGSPEGASALDRRAAREVDGWVRSEIARAIEAAGSIRRTG
ncbi:MAG: hypothetical protein EA351_05290 [Gemmatimonadales bacterium]|nr:MAG: hypothetical protein EA351_05290 [Gemmatimonadales bacterium]